jgi:hypothetical protein
MNKWKTAFWVCFIVWMVTLIIALCICVAKDIKYGFTKDARNSFSTDLGLTTNIINKHLITRKQIEAELKLDGDSFNDYKGKPGNDTSSLLRTDYVFRNDTLVKIIKRDE